MIISNMIINNIIINNIIINNIIINNMIINNMIIDNMIINSMIILTIRLALIMQLDAVPKLEITDVQLLPVNELLLKCCNVHFYLTKAICE